MTGSEIKEARQRARWQGLSPLERARVLLNGAGLWFAWTGNPGATDVDNPAYHAWEAFSDAWGRPVANAIKRVNGAVLDAITELEQEA